MRATMRNSLLVRLIGAFVLVILLGALVIYGLTTQATQNAFRIYATQNSRVWAQRLAPDLAAFYAQTNSWQGVAEYLQSGVPVEMPGMLTGPGGGSSGHGHGNGGGAGGGMGGGATNSGDTGGGMNSAAGMGWMGGIGQRLILADTQGMVIADSAGDLLGRPLSAQELAAGVPVLLDQQRVGTLVVTLNDQRGASNPASTFLATVNRAILISVLIAALVSLLLVSLLFLQIIAPVRQMQRVAGAIAAGDLTQRVPVTARDELGRLADSFNHMAASLSGAAVQRQKLFADVAHELRTPLAVIRANTEAMQDGVLPLEREQIDTIHSQTLLLGRLIDDLRLLSLAEAGELRLERQPVDLAVLLQATAERFQAQAAQQGVTLTCAVDAGLAPVLGDGDRLAQVLNNLVSNALRYTPAGGTVALYAAQLQGAAQVSVTDSGAGIAPADLPLVFERFYRADRSRARASGGTGLGLAIVRQLVEAHGGAVWAESPVWAENPASHEHGQGFGTRITFKLPGK